VALRLYSAPFSWVYLWYASVSMSKSAGFELNAAANAVA
jgi:hypothetical protein